MKTGFRKRAMSIVLSATMLIAVLCIAPATAAAATTDDGFTYTVANEEVTITGYTGAGGAVEIPAEIEGKPVTALGDLALAGATNPAAVEITSVVVPDSVKKMGAAIFNGCTKLTAVTLPEDVSIPNSNNMFRLTAIETIIIPNGMQQIGDSCFYKCTKLTSITFAEPSSVTSTGESSIEGCTSLTELVFPDGIQQIGGIYDCTALENVTIPDSVTQIADWTFDGCNKNLLTIHGSKDSVAEQYATKNGYKFAVVSGGDELYYGNLDAKIIETEKIIGDDAAYYTKDSLAVLQTELDAAKGVKETATEQGQIDGAAEALDAKIKALVFMPFQYAVSDNNEVTITGLNDDRTDIGVPSMDVVIPETIDGMPVTAIGAGAFENKMIKTVSIPVGIKTIGDNAFKSCASLASVTFAGGGLTAIGDNAFRSCQKLAAITLPETLQTIGVQAFLGARVLKTLTIPAAVTAIGDWAFGSCFELTDVYVLNNDVVYGTNVFDSSSKVILHAASDSTTEAYAIANELNFVSTTIIKYQYVLGDVDGNGEVNIADVLKIQNWLAKQIELENKALLAADVDANVKVEVADVLNIQKYKALMPVEFEIGETLEIDEADIPDYPAPPEIPTEPSSEATLPTEPPTQPDTEAPTVPEGQIPLYVSNAVSWITNDGCKLWAYNVDTQEFVLMEINLEGTYFSANVDESWQNIAFYRSTYDIDENTFSIDLPVEQMPNKWTSLPARGDNNCFLVTADSAGKWQVYDPDAPVQDTKTVYFDNSVTQWDTVYVYAWSFGLKNEFVEMEKVTDNIYKFTFPVAPTPGVDGFLFVNGAAWGGQQTVDCAVEEGKNLYTNLSGSGTSWTGTWEVYGAD